MTSSAGAVIQPIFQPVVLNVLPPEEMVTVRSRAPGSVAIGTCARTEGEVLVHLVGDDDRVVPMRELDDRLEHLAARAPMPVGLCGLLTRMIRVRSVTACAQLVEVGLEAGQRAAARCGGLPSARPIIAP